MSLDSLSSKTILEVRKVSKSFPGVQALDKVDMDIREGEVHALLGENGSGKSTLTKCIVGAYQRDSGKIVYAGNEVSFSSPTESFKQGISVIYQERSLIPKLSIEQNVFLGDELLSSGFLSENKMRKRFVELCESFGFDLPPEEKVFRLGVAQQKVVEIMKALSRNSRVVIMDEPTASLSKEEADHLFNIISQLKSRGISILYITHILDEVFRITDRITVLRDGKKISTLDTPSTNKEEVVNLMVGEVFHDVEDISSFARYDHPAVLSLKNIKKLPRVKDISFEVYPGEILGITGLTGSGKTELARAVFGAERVDSGEIFVDGKQVQLGSPVDAINSGIALIPEDRKSDGLVLLFEVFKNITLPAIDEFTIKPGIIITRKEYRKAEDYRERLNIRLASIQQQTKFLSGGNQQKVVIAKWLLTRPKLLIMDEATQGIDVKAKSEIYSIVRELAESGFSVVFISSEVQEVQRVSDRILVFADGEIAGEFKRGARQEEILKKALSGKQVQPEDQVVN